MSTTSPIQKILQRPDAALLAQQLNQALQDEARQREAFREWIDDTIKAEFINGEVVYHSPARQKRLEAARLLGGFLHAYCLARRIGVVWTEKAMIGLTRNDYEPDLVFFRKEIADTFSKDQVIFPAPDFIIEIISPSTAAKDRGVKKQDYAAHGISEYWIVDPHKQQLEQYLLMEAEAEYFHPHIYAIGESVPCRVLEGLQLPVEVIFDEHANVEALKKIFL